jgi:pimeloyl-ACP methyl ester carboxylesterase
MFESELPIIGKDESVRGDVIGLRRLFLASPTHTTHALVFVHGFNASHDEWAESVKAFCRSVKGRAI